MKKFEYKQKDYNTYPTDYELNKEGIWGWEIVDIFYFKDKICEYILEDRFKVTFKREIVVEE